MKTGVVLMFLCSCVWILNAAMVWHPVHFV